MPNLGTSEERWRLTIDNAPVGIALVSLEGQFMRVNHALCRMLGHSEEALHELTFQRVTHPEDLEADLELLQQLVDGELPGYHLRKRYLHADGHTIWADLSVSLVRTAEGRPLHFVSHITDRSEEVAAAEQIAQINRELREKTKRLERSNADLETFAMLVSHDLQAPLTTVRGYLEGLQDLYGESLDARANDWMARADNAAARMSELVNSLLAFARDGGADSAEREPVSIPDLVAEVCEDLDQLLSSTDARVGVEPPPPGAAEVLAYRSRLRQVLQNLIQNTVKYRHPDRTPHAVVSVEERGSHWQVTVTDNAVGVPAAQREQVFSMFARLDEREPGHGIGLAACRQVVERHGGRIWVEDNPEGPGSRFCFTLLR